MILRIILPMLLGITFLTAAEPKKELSWETPEGWELVEVGKDHFPWVFIGPDKLQISVLKHEFRPDGIWVICKVYREGLGLPLVTEEELEEQGKEFENGAVFHSFSNKGQTVLCSFYRYFGHLWILKFQGSDSAAKKAEEAFKAATASIKPDPAFAKYVDGLLEKVDEDQKAALKAVELYEEGLGVDKDEKKAFEMLLDLHEKGNLDATYKLAQKFLKVNKISNAFTLLQKGADANHLPSIKTLAALYLDYKNDRVEAHSLLKKAAERGDTESMFYLGTLYSVDDNFKDAEQAHKWIQMAAQKEYVPAVRQLGVFYRTGFGVDRNIKRAVDLLEMASAKGDVTSLEVLADIYRSGEIEGNKDFAKAREYLIRAALKGSTKALYMTAELYINGEGVEKDVAKGIDLLKQASEKGEIDADLLLGDLYTIGKEPEQDLAEAYKYYLKAAEAGNKYGMFKVALALLGGQGCEKDGEAAVRWLKRAAKLGYAPAVKALKDTGF